MPMSTGLLILCTPLPHLHSRLGGLVTAAARHVSKTLYVQLEPKLTAQWRPPEVVCSDPDYVRSCAKFISRFYARCHDGGASTNSLDVRFCVSGIKCPAVGGQTTRRDVEVVLTDSPMARLRPDVMRRYLSWRFARWSSVPKILSIVEDDDVSKTDDSEIEVPPVTDSFPTDYWKTHDRVVLGGTFDRLHSGHKILLNESVLRCTERLTIGICVGPMLAHKKLWELIEPIDVRKAFLNDFLTDIDCSLQYDLVPIIDPFGPSIEDQSLQGIVVSRETIAGGKKVNEKRIAKGMNALDLYVVELLADSDHCPQEEEKISSSSLRMRTLGHRREKTPPIKAELPRHPYIIGLTGGIASGKSSIARRLEDLGASIVDCDKLGHLSYAAGQPAYQKIVSHFGSDVVATDGAINRKTLGGKVFGNKAELEILNGIVWPEIQRMAQERISQAGEEGFQVVVLDAAVLLEAGWDKAVHEVWVSVVPEDEAIRRMKMRDGFDETQARQRLSRQISNVDRIAVANVVFSTLWEPEYTQTQVVKAWCQLLDHLKSSDYNSKM